jgi:hypothetical protein
VKKTTAPQGVSGVLPRKDFATYYGPDAALLPGQLIDCAVTKAAAAGGQAAVSRGPRCLFSQLGSKLYRSQTVARLDVECINLQQTSPTTANDH